jgi:hypothetical protein
MLFTKWTCLQFCTGNNYFWGAVDHLAVEIQSVMQTMQVFLINACNVCVEREAPLGECYYLNSELDTPTTG